MLSTHCYCLRRISFLAVIGLFVISTGCNSEPPPVKPPEWNPQEQAASAMSTYDKNSDGKIDSSEQSPGLKAALSSIDTDGDQAISEQEMVDKIQAFVDNGVGLIGVQGMVSYGGRKLPGATVTFVPEPFLADIVKPAKGTIDESGYYFMQTEGQDLEAVQPGIYTVEISKKDDAGNEQLPERYNQHTELGTEVGQVETAENRGSNQFNFQL